MHNTNIDENEFSGATGGFGGTSNSQPGLGTFSSPNVGQNGDSFYNSNNNKAIGPNSNTTGLNAQSGSMNTEVDKLFKGKETPSPDEIVTGIKYEMGQQIKKDKLAAKRKVIENLKKDPKFYSSLKMLNIDDDTMMDNINEQKDNYKAVTKQIFKDLEYAKNNRYAVNSNICDVMKQMEEQKRKRNEWKTGKTS